MFTLKQLGNEEQNIDARYIFLHGGAMMIEASESVGTWELPTTLTAIQ